MARGLDVRRLAAIDMWGSEGVRWRRWVILGEFLLGAFGLLALGLLALSSDGSPVRTLIGWWFVGVATNYAAVSAHALALARPGALEAEIAGANVPAELRYYAAAQLWVVVPLLLVVLAVQQRHRRPRPR